MSRTRTRRPTAGRGWFRGVRRWLALSVVGVAVITTALVLRVTTGPRNGYDVLFSLGTLLLILGALRAVQPVASTSSKPPTVNVDWPRRVTFGWPHTMQRGVWVSAPVIARR